MLSKKQSQPKNLIKYSFIFPLLLGFMILFNIKTEAKIRPIGQTGILNPQVEPDDAKVYSIPNTMSDDGLATLSDEVKKEKGSLKIRGLKRNEEGVIIAIEIRYTSQKGFVTSSYDEKEGISTIFFGENEQGGLFITTDEHQVSILMEGHMPHSHEHSEAKHYKSKTEAHVHDDSEPLRLGFDGKKPLVILDGKEVPHSTLDNLNTKGIESIDISKGEGALKKYGKKAENGVVEITSKKGKN